MTTLTPFALQHRPALIESVFPAQKVSFESQRERKAGAGQTLTALGSYWKGRKPLILVRAIVLGSLLPPTGDAEKDLEIYEQLLAFDKGGLARRALANNAFKPKEIAQTLILDNPWRYFTYKLNASTHSAGEISHWCFPLDADKQGISLKWRRETGESEKLLLYTQMLRNLPNYEARAALCKRPEELDQTELFAPVWEAVNAHYLHLGINAHTHQELVEQLGMLRFGHRPKVGDTFCGGGSIPFEAARLGCDVYASDLNPIACMLTWGALNIIGASPEKRAEIEQAQLEVAVAVDAEITEFGIEHDRHGNRAYAYLYCLEVECPQTGWMIPMLPSLAISKRRYDCRAYLIPDYEKKRFNIDIRSGVSKTEMEAADDGKVKGGILIYSLNSKTFWNYPARGWKYVEDLLSISETASLSGSRQVNLHPVEQIKTQNDLWITEPPYADAVHYHEITEYFIAWLRKNPPAPFNEWVWDSRRALAIKGSGDDFRRGMVEAYTAMTQHMPDNGMQCVMFTHQDTGVWSDMVGIFWAAGLQVVGAWYIATETTSELKKGGYVQGTVILMLRKRPAGDNLGFKQKILPAVRREVEAQITQMLHLNADVKNKLGEPVFNDSDLQMAGYAAALKVLTAYTHIGGEDATTFALRPRQKGQVTVVDEIVQQASEAANSLLIPEGLQPETWSAVKGIQRFYLRMLDIETPARRSWIIIKTSPKRFMSRITPK